MGWDDEVLKWLMIFGDGKWVTKDELAEAGVMWECIPVGLFRTKMEPLKLRLHTQQCRDALLVRWNKQHNKEKQND